MGRTFRCMLAVLTVALIAPALASAQVRAGAAAVDTTWHVGASAGQYASDGTFGVDPADGTYDPTVHSYRRGSSYGIQSRLSARALVVEGPDGHRVAIVKNDLYIPQDLLYRRTAQLLEEEGDCGIGRETLTVVSTHNHSSPLYSSTAFGVWTFQDVFDVRFYDYLARRMALAVERACDGLVPARMGAAVSQFDLTHRHSFGPAIGDDGTPAGYPHSDIDKDLSVVRFDDISDPSNPKPLANLVNWSGHPEFLEGNDLISADYVGPLERMVDRGSGGAVTIFSQGAVGTSEPERSVFHSLHERLEFTHRDYAQAEFGARLLADAVLGASDDIEAETPEDPSRFVPFDDDFAVKSDDRWFPGPFSHPYPGVSNCRTDKGLAGDPQLPVVGLPTCQGVQSGLGELSNILGLPDPPDAVPGIDPGLNTDDFQRLGIPVPENYSAPGYAGLQEDIDVHLQALRLGDILLTMCSCEQWRDQSQNIETRTDRIAGNEYLGYDWSAQCDPVGDGDYRADGQGTGTWSCPNPGNPSQDLPAITDSEYAKFRAQVVNPANGWNNADNAAEAESEPTDPREIKGNYTHDDRCGAGPLAPGNRDCLPGETSPSAAMGYGLTIPIGMANDYNGYIATYREYQRGDAYRKSLTAWGPHSSDYMASRLVTMGRRLREPNVILPLDQIQESALAAKAVLDTAINDQRARALGETGGAAIAAYEAALPDDGGEPGAIDQPADTERFGASTFRWLGGSNFTDDPVVTVERSTADGWVEYADGSGEVPITLKLPQAGEAPSYLNNDQRWRWTAHFEAFVAGFDLGDRPRATPQGTYRFVAEGRHRDGGAAVPYRVVSDEFEVEPWSGITATDLRRESDGTLSFAVGPSTVYDLGSGAVDVEGDGAPISDEIGPVDYPDSYESDVRFIRERRTAFRDPAAPDDPDRLEWYCFTCSFRPWLDAGDVSDAVVTIFDERTGESEGFAATRVGGRWVSDRVLQPGELAVVESGSATDEWGNLNGAASNAVYGGDPPDPPPPPGKCEVTLPGGAGADVIVGTGLSELLSGFAGRDSLRGKGGVDCLYGGRGRDVLRGGGGKDFMDGGRDPDRVIAGGGDDRVRSYSGGNDVVRCGPGRDRALVGPLDTVRGCERVVVRS